MLCYDRGRLGHDASGRGEQSGRHTARAGQCCCGAAARPRELTVAEAVEDAIHGMGGGRRRGDTSLGRLPIACPGTSCHDGRPNLGKAGKTHCRQTPASSCAATADALAGGDASANVFGRGAEYLGGADWPEPRSTRETVGLADLKEATGSWAAVELPHRGLLA